MYKRKHIVETGASAKVALAVRHKGSGPNMKLCLFQTGAKAPVQPGLITERGVVSILPAAKKLAAGTPTETMIGIIDHYDELKPALEKLARSAKALPLARVRLRAPLMRPGKVLCCIGNYWEHQVREPKPLNMFLKNPDATIGPGDTIMLPENEEPSSFQHEAELALVFKGPAKGVKQKNWRKAIFGYSLMIDVSARSDGRFNWRRGSWMSKSFDTFGPLGPCIVTADEIEDPNNLQLQFWNDGQLRHDYSTNDMEHRVPALVEFATGVMTMNSGDIIACGTNHEGLGPLQDGEKVTIEIKEIGRMTLKVKDRLKRKWERGIFMGSNSTHPDAVRRRQEAERGQAARSATG
jgi:2-keto-4-pentenoate hydratase/2-oxohepta-3-ene-1,7-dioic acid hydratase in catechol pathway